MVRRGGRVMDWLVEGVAAGVLYPSWQKRKQMKSQYFQDRFAFRHPGAFILSVAQLEVSLHYRQLTREKGKKCAGDGHAFCQPCHE